MRLLRLLGLVLLAVLLVPGGAARAQVDDPCPVPDTQGPIIYDFAIGPSIGTNIGTRVHAVADDSLSGCTTISQVVLSVDPRPDGTAFLVVDMDPVTGDRHYGMPDQRETVEAVLALEALQPDSTHTMRITAYDGNEPRNVGSRDYRVYYFTPFLTGTCEGAPPGFCS